MRRRRYSTCYWGKTVRSSVHASRMSDCEYKNLPRLVVHAVDDAVVSDPHAPIFEVSRSAHLGGSAGSGVFGESTNGL